MESVVLRAASATQRGDIYWWWVRCVGGAALNTWVHEAQALHSLFLLIESRVEIFEEISFSFQW